MRVNHVFVVVGTFLLLGNYMSHAFVASTGRNLVSPSNHHYAYYKSTSYRRHDACMHTKRHLFFEERKNKQQSSLLQEATFIKDLKSPTLQLPYTFVYPLADGTEELLTVRHLENTDLEQLVPICVHEFNPAATFPLRNLSVQSLKEWIENSLFPILIRLSLLTKIERRRQGQERQDMEPDYNVLCLACRDELIGIVELSQQPLDPHRNPHPFPKSIDRKLAYANRKLLPQHQSTYLTAWVTNLMVISQYRNRGYAKLLMAAVQGLARQWNKTSIHLHVNANAVGGCIPQRLYQRLGYKPVTVLSPQQAAKFEWMGPEMIQTGLVMVEGAPLLFLEKKLTPLDESNDTVVAAAHEVTTET